MSSQYSDNNNNNNLNYDGGGRQNWCEARFLKSYALPKDAKATVKIIQTKHQDIVQGPCNSLPSLVILHSSTV